MSVQNLKILHILFNFFKFLLLKLALERRFCEIFRSQTHFLTNTDHQSVVNFIKRVQNMVLLNVNQVQSLVYLSLVPLKIRYFAVLHLFDFKSDLFLSHFFCSQNFRIFLKPDKIMMKMGYLGFENVRNGLFE